MVVLNVVVALALVLAVVDICGIDVILGPIELKKRIRFCY